MSLLIKALQKAEQSKSEAAVNAAAPASPPVPASPLALELAPPHETLSPSLHEESGFDAATPSATRTQQAAASAVFRAGRQNGVASVGGARIVWLAGGGMLVLLLIGGGFYYYLNSLEQPTLVVTRPNLPQPAPVAAAPVVAESSSAPAIVENEKPVEVPPPSVMPQETPRAAVAESASAKTDELVASVADKPKVQSGDEALPKVTRNRAPKAVVSDDVMAGYQAYMAGDDAAAGRHYRAAVKADPRNIDALLGLAAMAARQGKGDEATTHYLQVLELEPRNVAAQTGLIGLVGQTDPAASESRLKTLLAQQPEAAFLHEALGNLYADQGQWPSAQQAYFQAYRFDARNAEYAFNLAVSLDQMGKPALALTHYQRALELLPAQGGSLDRSQLEARIAQLRQSAGQ